MRTVGTEDQWVAVILPFRDLALLYTTAFIPVPVDGVFPSYLLSYSFFRRKRFQSCSTEDHAWHPVNIVYPLELDKADSIVVSSQMRKNSRYLVNAQGIQTVKRLMCMTVSASSMLVIFALWYTWASSWEDSCSARQRQVQNYTVSGKPRLQYLVQISVDQCNVIIACDTISESR